MSKIILTGGGTAGHVIPHFALLPYFKNNHIELLYIGSKNGIEKELVLEKSIPYIGISSGKLRRYFDMKNFTDPFRIIAGFFQAISCLIKNRPDLVFSKGGFVSVPVVAAAWLLRIPVIAHESDMTPGLANKLAAPFTKKILTTFEETLNYLPKNKGIFTGSPVRQSLKNGNKAIGYDLTGFNDSKPVIMVMGGSLGAQKINHVLREALPLLLDHYQIIHLCGSGNLDKSLTNKSGYVQYEYVNQELPHLFSITDFMVSRAGSNAINEFAYLQLPSLLIPLSKNASRGDQILNAKVFESKGYAQVLPEENLTVMFFVESIDTLYKQLDNYVEHLSSGTESTGTQNVYHEIISILRKEV
jgi:UDP-N-acetylglucosamine--N-acetylmuramyl-(pentapeptide) pyrophosphoryl-undecaprenol N-acetylglucosamine transferase